MRDMTEAAFSIGKRSMQTETSHLFCTLLMAEKTHGLLIVDKQFFFTRFMRIVTSKAFALRCRRVGKRAATVHCFVMALVAELRRLARQKLVQLGSMTHVTGQTLTLTVGVMHTAGLNLLFAGMTASTYLFRHAGKQENIFTGMRSMTLNTTALGIGLMQTGHFLAGLRMTGYATGICAPLYPQGTFGVNQMADITLALADRFMHFAF
jgi:hypothetical protein